MELQSQLLLILGIQRSGTTLLASMLGRHSEINMLFESTTRDVKQLIGKKYNGNKLLAWRQIRMTERASYLGHLKNRLANNDLFGKTRKHHGNRPAPTSKMSVQDYMNMNAKMIVILRKKEDTIKSILKRTKMSHVQAEKEWQLADDILQACLKKGALQVTFNELVQTPQATMENICDYLELDFEPRMLEGSKFNIVYPQDSINADRASKDES